MAKIVIRVGAPESMKDRLLGKRAVLCSVHGELFVTIDRGSLRLVAELHALAHRRTDLPESVGRTDVPTSEDGSGVRPPSGAGD